MTDPRSRLEIVTLLLTHGVPAPDLVPTARDVWAFVSGATPDLVVNNKKPEPRLPESPKPEGGIVRWTRERQHELERWCASGAPYDEISDHFGTTTGAIRFAARKFGINKRWPRQKGTANKLLFTPIPLDAPWPSESSGIMPDPAPRPAGEAEAGIAPTEADTLPTPEPQPARRPRPPAARPEETIGTADPREPIVAWLRGRGVDLRKEGDSWRWDGEAGLTFRQILGRANNLRIRQGLGPFADPEPDPLALPVTDTGRLICGSSLGDEG